MTDFRSKSFDLRRQSDESAPSMALEKAQRRFSPSTHQRTPRLDRVAVRCPRKLPAAAPISPNPEWAWWSPGKLGCGPQVAVEFRLSPGWLPVGCALWFVISRGFIGLEFVGLSAQATGMIRYWIQVVRRLQSVTQSRKAPGCKPEASAVACDRWRRQSADSHPDPRTLSVDRPVWP